MNKDKLMMEFSKDVVDLINYKYTDLLLDDLMVCFGKSYLYIALQRTNKLEEIK